MHTTDCGPRLPTPASSAPRPVAGPVPRITSPLTGPAGAVRALAPVHQPDPAAADQDVRPGEVLGLCLGRRRLRARECGRAHGGTRTGALDWPGAGGNEPGGGPVRLGTSAELPAPRQVRPCGREYPAWPQQPMPFLANHPAAGLGRGGQDAAPVPARGPAQRLHPLPLSGGGRRLWRLVYDGGREPDHLPHLQQILQPRDG